MKITDPMFPDDVDVSDGASHEFQRRKKGAKKQISKVNEGEKLTPPR
jgi:hypothetical protein